MLAGLEATARETSDDTLSSVVAAGQRALEQWQRSVTCLRHHEQVHERAASDERRARDRLHSVLELVGKLSDQLAVISPPVGHGQGTQRRTGSQLVSGGANRAGLAVRLLGGFALDLDGKPVCEWHGRRALSIIQFLVLNRRSAVCRETLIDAIWPEIPGDRGRRRLHQGIYDLRSTLRDVDPGRTHIICVDGSYRLNPAMPVWVDSEEFDRLVSAAGHSQADNRIDEAFELCQTAEVLYHGDFLSDAMGADWATVERNRLRARYVVVCNQLAELHVARGEHRRAVAVLDRVLGKDPWNEDSARIEMRCYVEMGQSSLALGVFRSCAQALAQELGVRPCAETLQLYHEIRGAVTAPAPRTQS